MSKPKVCFIHRGLQDYRLELFNKLHDKLKAHIILTWGENKKKMPDLFEKARFKSTVVKEIRPFLAYSEGFSLELITHLWKKRYDVIITSDLTSFATHISFLIAKLTGAKFLIWDELWEWPRTLGAKIAWPYCKLIARHCDGYLMAGTKAAEFYISIGAKKEKVFIANDSAVDMKGKANPGRVQELRAKHNLEGKKVALYLSRIIKYKGLDYLIKAFKEVEQKEPNSFLLIAGPDVGGFEEHCKKLAKQIGLQNYAFIGRVPHEDVANYYSLCDVFVLPSRFLYEDNVTNEAWGLVVNEVMSTSKPVISTTAVASAFDLIENGVNGYRVKEQSSKELADAILKTLPKSEELGNAARKRFEEWNNYTKQTRAFVAAIQKAK
ncbi:glycosyltransferase family 4 protein [Candidatus Woesearchaeota archaeon]|nr:glycosyltransferase family 4 protein [Candidatus Woesearchaeota archaeon]